MGHGAWGMGQDRLQVLDHLLGHIQLSYFVQSY